MQGTASYSNNVPQEIQGMKRVNCFYGLNGSGKSTIAKYLQDPSSFDYVSCYIDQVPTDSILVYNSKFVKDNFWDSADQPGVFTVNEGNVDAEKAIEAAETQIVTLTKDRLLLEDAADEIKEQKKKEEIQLENKLWVEKDKFVKTPLAFCLERKQQKKLFLDAVKEAEEASSEINIHSLNEQAKELEKPDITPKQHLPKISFNGSIFELDSINSEVIIGASESYLSALIDKLGHSDWVRDGHAHFDQLESTCPFCQQTTREDFEENLKSLFDEVYKQKCSKVETNTNSYAHAIKRVEDALLSECFSDEYVTQNAEFSIAKADFLECCRQNLALLKEKGTKPSKPIELLRSEHYLNKLNLCIDAINKEIGDFNSRITSKPQIKAKIKKQFWQVHKRTYKTAIELVDERLLNLEKELIELRNDYKQKSEAINAQKAIITDHRKQTTNIDTAIENIRNTLVSVGVDDFHISKVDGSDARYKIVRKDGFSSKVYESLSEGEKTLITFLYFLELCKGLTQPDSDIGLADKIIVIDDPVSSLSHNFVYEIATLIQKEIVKKQFKQVFLFTHNLFFFHEIMNQSRLKQDYFDKAYSLYRVRKDEFSKITPILRGDIQNEYDGYWQIIRDAKADRVCSPILPNAMRNILEHFFSFVHKKDKLADILSKLGDQHNNFKPLLRYISRESHSDLVNLTDYGDIDVGRFLEIFRQVFVKAEYEDHYKRMIK